MVLDAKRDRPDFGPRLRAKKNWERGIYAPWKKKGPKALGRTETKLNPARGKQKAFYSARNGKRGRPEIGENQK